MQLITNRTLHTPYSAHYARASESGNVMTVEYFTIAKHPIVQVNMPARIMERTAYEAMVKVKDPAEAKKNAAPEDPHKREKAHKERTDLPKGKNLSAGEEDALADVEDAKKDPKGSIGDDDYFEIEIDGPEAKEPKPNQVNAQKMNEDVSANSLRQAEEDDLFTAEQIRKAMTELPEFDDEEARDKFISVLGRPCCNMRDMENVDEEMSEDTFDRLFNS